MQLVFVRHGQSLGNELGFEAAVRHEIPNHAFPLTEQGILESRAAGALLRDRSRFPVFNHAFVSPMLRARQTFRYLDLGVPGVIDPRLTEWWKGVWHSSTPEDLDQAFPLERGLARKHGWYFHRPPGGESFLDAHIRMLGFVESRRPWDRDETDLVVSHGRLFRALQMVLGVSTLEDVFTPEGLVEVPNCSIFRYEYLPTTREWKEVFS